MLFLELEHWSTARVEGEEMPVKVLRKAMFKDEEVEVLRSYRNGCGEIRFFIKRPNNLIVFDVEAGELDFGNSKKRIYMYGKEEVEVLGQGTENFGTRDERTVFSIRFVSSGKLAQVPPGVISVAVK